MKTRRPRWRRQYYVHPIQRKYFFLSLVPLIVCAFLLVVGVFGPMRLMLLRAELEVDPALYLGQMYALALRIWPLMLISVVVSGLLSFLVTNRFAGPIFRFERILEGVEAGQLPRVPVRVRRGDDFQEFSRHLDNALSLIRSALAAIHNHEQRASQELAALEEQLKSTPHATEEMIQRVDAIARHHRDVEGILARFTLQSQADAPESDPQAARETRPVPAV